MKFVSRLESGERMADLCREFGISRKTGYKLADRYRSLSIVGLLDQSRAPHYIPHRTPPEIRAAVVALRAKHPTWGARKLRDVLARKQPEVRWPVTSTIGEILRTEGLTTPRRVRRSIDSPYSPLSHAVQPNDVWSIDFKGQFRLRSGRYCYPLTVTDGASRFILACEGFESIDGGQVRQHLEGVFARNGLPAAMRFDGGPPFASARSLARLSSLSAWWLRLGIRLEQIEPASPQQNGRHERMHRTLKAETTRPAGLNMLQQQERFDRFVEVFNHDRPHEGLGMKRPAEIYRRSDRRFSKVLPDPEYPLHDATIRVSTSGHIYLPGSGGGRTFLTTALRGERVGIRELDDGRWLISYLDLDLAILDLETNRLSATTENSHKVSPMCPV
jgi:transposase InsO family protein